jgi:hypothetical protein
MKVSGKKQSRYPGWHLWESDSIWTAYRLNSEEAEECLPAIGKYAFIYNARLLGRKLGETILVLMSFDTQENQALFLAAIREEKLAPKTIAPTRFDIEHAWPLAQVLSSRLNQLMEDEAVGDPVTMRFWLEELDKRDKQGAGDFIFPFSDDAKRLLERLRKLDI